eukprot:CAMPEP_0119493548 /NCGR_PEP_ID=MMETSP1344-20130328/17773_1 /TAXON_ID=236787 /ORGANISM="Florenciella parvula, Strain CCMP2471" /LENGTH=81 /DNA_ID=CAMNT_0007528985 /DNA_START=177 /DNA_END=419 /DNA_ORIENTATION=-
MRPADRADCCWTLLMKDRPQNMSFGLGGNGVACSVPPPPFVSGWTCSADAYQQPWAVGVLPSIGHAMERRAAGTPGRPTYL